MTHNIFQVLTSDVRNRCAGKLGDFCQNDDLAAKLTNKIGEAALEYVSGSPETNFVFEQIIDKLISMDLTALQILEGQDNGNFQIAVNDAVNYCHRVAIHDHGIQRS